jgi:hypothetical protein
MSDPNGNSVISPTDQSNCPPRERRQRIRYSLNDMEGGAAALSERAPAQDRILRLRLDSHWAPKEPLEARLVAASADPSGKQRLRLQFTRFVSLDAIFAQQEERRLWQRYPARETRAMLIWTEDRVERMVRGELVDISGGGAAVAINSEPPSDKPIRFGIESEARAIDQVESRLFVISIEPNGEEIAHLRFVEPCPIALFELAVHGPV